MGGEGTGYFLFLISCPPFYTRCNYTALAERQAQPVIALDKTGSHFQHENVLVGSTRGGVLL
jgi:hypothetical protein